jgi:membrane protein DedA with SNARE-associated domain
MSGLDKAAFDLLSGLFSAGGYWGIFLAMTLESAGIPLPSEIVMPLAGYLVSQGHFTLVGAVLAGTLGNLLGSMIAYEIGRAGGRPLLLRYGKYVLISPRELELAERWFARYGQITVLISRVVPIVRTYFSFPAGAARMPFGRFCLYTFLGSLPWSFALTYLGVVLGQHFTQQLGGAFRMLDYLVAALIVLAVGWYVYRHVRAAAHPTTPTPTAVTPAPPSE